jgi:RimK family alpha-L-glutamate ligase
MKTGWLILSSTYKSPKHTANAERFKSSFLSRGIALDVVFNDELIFVLSGRRELLSKRLPDFVLFWDKDVRLAYNLEAVGLRVFNTARAIEICDDKSLSYHYLTNAGVACPKTIFCPKLYYQSRFSSEKFLDAVIGALGLPLVVKENFGSFGVGVSLANDKDEILELTKKIGARPFVFQQFIKESAGRDLRVYVCDGKVVGCVRRVNDKDFRSNVEAGGVMEPYNITKAQGDVALAAARAAGAHFAGVDILFSKDAPLVCEINSNAYFLTFLDTTGIDFSASVADMIKNVLNKRS